MNYKFCIIGTKDTTISLLEYLAEKNKMPQCIITIDSNTINTDNISGFSPLDKVAKKYNIDLFQVEHYSMQDEKTKTFFEENTFEIAVCMGWQRLIPKYILEKFRHGIFGFHGSCGYLPYGRGRSPLNWSVVLGDERFIVNLFQYDEQADSPNVFANRMFQINEHDTIRTLQYKNLLCSYEMVEELLMAYEAGVIGIQRSSRDFDSLYEKRTPTDGKIDFTKKTREIYNLIRGVTAPFPGAFAYLETEQQRIIKIWEAVPFDAILNFSKYAVGEIIENFDGMLVVRTIDGSLLLKNYECDSTMCKGNILY